MEWKALLRRHPYYGGNVSLVASCTGCSAHSSTTINDLTFGDAWIILCSGQRIRSASSLG